MIVTVTGGVSSGKSGIAENIACFLGGEKIYIAAMQPYGDEALQRIENHRKARAGKGFITIERQCDIAELELEPCGTILFECVSNLLANEMFSESVFELDAILKGFDNLECSAENLVIVTNDVSGIVADCYSESVKSYIENMGTINRYLASLSDVFIESVVGIPIFMKGFIAYETNN